MILESKKNDSLPSTFLFLFFFHFQQLIKKAPVLCHTLERFPLSSARQTKIKEKNQSPFTERNKSLSTLVPGKLLFDNVL